MGAKPPVGYEEETILHRVEGDLIELVVIGVFVDEAGGVRG